MFPEQRQFQHRAIASQQNPKTRLKAGTAIIDGRTFEVELFRHSSHYRREIQRSIADVNRENSVRIIEVLEVKPKSFLGQEMDGDGITVEGVEDEDIEV